MNSQNSPSASLSNEQLQQQHQQAYQEWKGLIEVLNIYATAHQQATKKLDALVAKNPNLADFLAY